MDSNFFDRVKHLVRLKKITIKEFTESLDISYDTYNGLRRLGNLPRVDEALKIANALGVSVEYLVTGKEPDNSSAVNDVKRKLTELTDSINKL